ncbi:MAG: hypothetical protein LBR44_05265 [Clostridiales Family XIII bacterium]|jgi:hypothetical protein|nr:hypothetical protein [Clostridiales Family XIII bacterium]
MSAEPKAIFTDVMSPGIILAGQIQLESMRKQYPDYLEVKKVVTLRMESRLNPADLAPSCAYVYNDNLYLTDDKGNIAYIDSEMMHTDDASAIRKAHGEYKSVGGAHASHEGMDAGHFGIALGQHPSIAMEQDIIMNRYGAWRMFERSWYKLSQAGHTVNVKAVFVEGDDDGTFSPFWCVRETIDDTEVNEYVLTNDDTQS